MNAVKKVHSRSVGDRTATAFTPSFRLKDLPQLFGHDVGRVLYLNCPSLVDDLCGRVWSVDASEPG